MPNTLKKIPLSFASIINMNVGFLGIQYSFGLQQTAINPVFDLLHAKPAQIPLLNLAGPITGLIIQPIIGAMSDKTWHPKFGRRKPYFVVGAVLCSICLFVYPFCSQLWMAAGMLWILDAANNIAMQPYRTLIADKLPRQQLATGFLTQSFFTGLGITLANLSLFFFQKNLSGSFIKLPYWVLGSFFLGSVCYIGSVAWSVYKTPEILPTPDEMNEIKAYNKNKPHPVLQMLTVLLAISCVPIFIGIVLKNYCSIDVLTFALLLVSICWLYGLGFIIKKYASHYNSIKIIADALLPFTEIIDAIIYMPKVMWQLAAVYLFQWYALFCYWQFATKSVANSVWKTFFYSNNKNYEAAVGWTALVNGWYNIVTVLSAVVLVVLAKKFSARATHAACLTLAAIGLLIFPNIENKYLLFVPMTGFGIAWASIMGIPYMLVVNQIPKERYGVYMGIINVLIVVPMIIQTISFKYVFKYALNESPTKAITVAGCMLLVAAALVLRIKTTETAE